MSIFFQIKFLDEVDGGCSVMADADCNTIVRKCYSSSLVFLSIFLSAISSFSDYHVH